MLKEGKMTHFLLDLIQRLKQLNFYVPKHLDDLISGAAADYVEIYMH